MKKGKASTPLYAVNIQGQEGREVTVFLSGRIALEDLAAFRSDMHDLLRKMSPGHLAVDLAGVEYLDSAGALVLLQLQREAQSRQIPCQLANLSDATKRIVDLLQGEPPATPPLITTRVSGNLVEQVGEASLSFLNDLAQVTTFLGALIAALFQGFLHPRTVRWSEVAFYMKRAGVAGLPIVGLISLLLGLILAFMSSLQLKQFGANIYVASLLAISVVKELGPIMTAILVAGRSGSAFAAEIGTMKVNEEVDALISMGFDPIPFLALPKVLATMIVLPLLTIYADLFGIAGGLIVGIVGLDLTAYTYLKETQASLTLMDIIPSLIKTGVFALLIAGIGCQRGFQVRGGAEAVGSATTSAVVAAIFLIIITDSAFALVFHYLGI